MKIPVAIKILNEATGPKANVEFMDVSIFKTKRESIAVNYILDCKVSVRLNVTIIFTVQTQVLQKMNQFLKVYFMI